MSGSRRTSPTTGTYPRLICRAAQKRDHTEVLDAEERHAAPRELHGLFELVCGAHARDVAREVHIRAEGDQDRGRVQPSGLQQLAVQRVNPAAVEERIERLAQVACCNHVVRSNLAATGQPDADRAPVALQHLRHR